MRFLSALWETIKLVGTAMLVAGIFIFLEFINPIYAIIFIFVFIIIILTIAFY